MTKKIEMDRRVRFVKAVYKFFFFDGIYRMNWIKKKSPLKRPPRIACFIACTGGVSLGGAHDYKVKA